MGNYIIQWEGAINAQNKSYNLFFKCCKYSRPDTFQTDIIELIITATVQHKYLDVVLRVWAKLDLDRKIRRKSVFLADKEREKQMFYICMILILNTHKNVHFVNKHEHKCSS